jgi:low affinity Fe/Cu permease
MRGAPRGYAEWMAERHTSPDNEPGWFERFASATSTAAGHPRAFGLAATLVIAWALSGPIFHFSDTWQLVINTGTTVLTFLMVFLIQSTLNRDTIALHLKLDELIRVTREARNSLIGSQRLPEAAIRALDEAERKANEPDRDVDG